MATVALLSNPADHPARATREALGATLIELADEGAPIAAVDADLASSTTLGKFGAANETLAQRFFDVGIAEQDMIGVAAGLSLTGLTVFTGSFSVFGTGRCYDQIRNTVCYSDLNVKITPTHSGVSVGPDGGSHQMLEDIALMRVLPRMRVLVPADYEAARAAIRLAATTPGPVYVRMGRAKVPQVYEPDQPFGIGEAQILRPGRDVSIIACGVEIREALVAADILAERGIEAEVIDVFSVKPLDEQTILESAHRCGCVVTAEEHEVVGGMGDAVCALLATSGPTPVEMVGVQDRFGRSASFEELLELFKLDAGAIVAAAEKALSRKYPSPLVE